MAKRKPAKAECEHCGRTYRKCRRNVHTQKYCLHEACVRARQRQRQRRHYREKYRCDGAFREAERARCSEHLRQRRAAVRAAKDPHGAKESAPNLQLVLLGVMGALTDAQDPTAAQASMRRFERRGQRLSVSAPLARGAPPG